MAVWNAETISDKLLMSTKIKCLVHPINGISNIAASHDIASQLPFNLQDESTFWTSASNRFLTFTVLFHLIVTSKMIYIGMYIII